MTLSEDCVKGGVAIFNHKYAIFVPCVDTATLPEHILYLFAGSRGSGCVCEWEMAEAFGAQIEPVLNAAMVSDFSA